MDDERLLSEALRAHAAGGVSTPMGAAGVPDDQGGEGHTQPADEGPGTDRVRGRFRPLGRARRDQTPAPEPAGRTTPVPPGGARPVAVPGPPPPAPSPEPTGWPGTRVAWWSAVAILGGGVLGALIAVISLAAPG